MKISLHKQTGFPWSCGLLVGAFGSNLCGQVQVSLPEGGVTSAGTDRRGLGSSRRARTRAVCKTLIVGDHELPDKVVAGPTAGDAAIVISWTDHIQLDLSVLDVPVEVVVIAVFESALFT